MFLVIKFDDAQKREVAINRDGSTENDLALGELLNRIEVQEVKDQYGGKIVDEDRIFDEEE